MREDYPPPPPLPPVDNDVNAAVLLCTQETKELEPKEAAGLSDNLDGLQDDCNKKTALANERIISFIRQTKIREVHSGLCLASIDNLMRTVNKHLKYCTFSKGSRLQLKVDRRIGLDSNYKLVCKSCDTKDRALLQNI